MAPQPLLGFDAAAGNARHDAPAAQVGLAEGIVVALVGMELGGAPTGLSPVALDSRHGIDERHEALAIMDVGAGKHHGQGQSVTVDQQVMFAAELSRSVGLEPRVVAAPGGKGRCRRQPRPASSRSCRRTLTCSATGGAVFPDAGGLPLFLATQAGCTAAATKFPGWLPPGNGLGKNEEYPGEGRPVGNPGAAAYDGNGFRL